jgi:hypothetical protein
MRSRDAAIIWPHKIVPPIESKMPAGRSTFWGYFRDDFVWVMGMTVMTGDA